MEIGAKTDRKDEESNISGVKVVPYRDQHHFDRDQAKVRTFQNYKGSRSSFIIARDQYHLLIAIKDGKIRVFG